MCYSDGECEQATQDLECRPLHADFVARDWIAEKQSR